MASLLFGTDFRSPQPAEAGHQSRDTDWADNIINLAGQNEGRGIPITDRALGRNQLMLERIIRPLYATKYAGVPEFLDSQTVDAIRAFKISEPGQFLRQFITEDGGHNAIKKLSNTAKSNFKFARVMFKAFKLDDYAPELPSLTKPAAAPRDLLVLRAGILHNQQVKQASDHDLAQGYQIDDLRKEGEYNETVYAPLSRHLESVNLAGIYQVLMKDGSLREMLVANHGEVDSIKWTREGQGSEKATMPNQQPRPRRTFDEAFKRDAVALLLKGDKRAKQLAQELGVSIWNLRDWREQYGPSAPAQTTEQLEAELRRLRRENDSLRTQRDILKKTLGILAEPAPNATSA